MPCVSYYDATKHDLRMAHYVGYGGNCGARNDWHCQTVDTGVDVGKHSSIAIHPGYPFGFGPWGIGIAYHDATNGSLKYATTQDPQGGPWAVHTIEGGISSVSTTGLYPSLKFSDSGNPVIAHYFDNPTNVDALKLAYCSVASGNCESGDLPDSWRCETIITGEGVGQYPSLADIDEFEFRVAYYDEGRGDLWYATSVGEGNCGPYRTDWSCFPMLRNEGAREQLKAGADVIKVMATAGVMTQGTDPGSVQLTFEELRATVEEGEKAGKLTAAHAYGAAGIKNAIRAGSDSIEHGFFLDTEAIDMMLERETTLVPTLAPIYEIIHTGPEFGVPASVIEKAERASEAHVDSFRRAREAGVRIAAGNDGGRPFNPADNLAGELERMVAAGMTPVEALAAAHSTAAELLRMSEQIGTVEPGKLADLVVLNADPQEDISAVRRVHMVTKAGQRVRGHPQTRPAYRCARRQAYAAQ